MTTRSQQVRSLSQDAQSSSPAADRLRRFGLRITFLRKRRGWSQRELARRLGVSSPTMSRFESGDREPGLDILLRAATVLGVSLDQLVRGEP